MRLPVLLFASVVLAAVGAFPLHAQDFLQASYAGPTGKPAQLNVCGDTDLATYRVERAPGAATASAIEVTVELFEGIRAVGLDAARSGPGVSVVSLANPNRPVISIPNISSGSPRVDFTLILQARCGILDTIRVNNTLDVRDVLSFRFRAVGQARTERHVIDPYLGSISFPVFTINTSLSRSPLRVGETVERRVDIANGSFNGYTDTLVYELAQGPGASVREMRVNGAVVPFGKTLNAAGDTVIRVVLSGNQFAGNRNGSNPGNGDTRFDPNERLTITQTVFIRRCSESRLASHTTQFGCDGSACATTSIQSDLPIGSGQPALRVTESLSAPTVDVGYCQLGELNLWVSNLGRESDPTFGQARDISVSALASFGGLLAANNYRIARVEIAGRDIATLSPVIDLDLAGVFDTDPDGVGVGLEDLDGDGIFDDLAILDSFPIKIFYEFDCASASVYDLDENCANDASTTFQAFAYFDDACGNRIEGSNPSVHSPRNIQDDFEQRTQPDAFALGAPFQVELAFGRLVFDFENSCSPAAELRAYVVLPTGVTIDNGTSSLNRGGGTPMPLLGVVVSGDTAMLRFSPAAEIALSGEYTLTLGLSADCTAPLGETIFPTTVAYYCPDCDCEHTWICEEIIGPWIHKTAPPCLISELYPCPNGVQGTGFEINRTTLGFSDPAFTMPINPALANTKVAIPADSVDITIRGVVGDGLVTDDLGIIIHYFTPTEREDTAGLFLLGGGTLEWVDGGVVRTCTVPATPHTLETLEDETWQRFDLSACIAANGWIMHPGDEVRFFGAFEINPAGPIATSYEFVEDLRGGFYVEQGGVETLCDQFGDVFRVGRPLTVFGTASNDQYPKGCAPATLEFKLTSVNRGYVEEFGPEYRRAARLDSIMLTFDTAIFSAFEDLSVDLLVSGHPTQGNSAFAIRPLTDFPDGRYVLSLDTLDFTASLVDNYTSLYSMRVNLAPNCGSIRSSSNGDEFYAMRSEPYYRDRYYAIDIGDGSRVDAVYDPVSFVMTYEDPARLRMDQLTAAYQRLVSDSAYVTIEICNTSSVSAAGRNWVTFNDTTVLSVEEAILLDDASNPINLPIEAFVGGHFINLEGLGQVNGVNTSRQVCNLVRFKVRANGCGINSVAFATGWACEATVPPGWTPDQDRACVDDQVLTTFEPIAPFLEADLLSQPLTSVDLCTPITMEFQVNNAQLGTSYDVRSQFYIPVGMRYVPGSAEVAYPPSAAYQPVVTDLASTPATLRGLGLAFADLADVHPYLGSNGLAGFNVAEPDDSSRFVIRMTFESDCQFRSGSLLFFEAEGTEACGTATNLAATESAALRINGTEPDGTHLFEVGFASSSRVKVAQPVSTFEIFATNAGGDPSDADDVLEVMLPAGFTYEAGTVSVVLPEGYSAPEPTLSAIGSVQRLEFAIPVGLAPGEEYRLRFDVRSGGVACSDAVQASIAAFRYMAATCASLATVCRIPSDVTVGGLRYEGLPVGDVFFSDEAVNRSTCAGPSTEAIELLISLTPLDFALDASPVSLVLYSDLDGDGLIGTGDTLINATTVQPVAGQPTIDYAFAGVLQRRHVGTLYLRVESATAGVCQDQIVPINLPRLDNAGAQADYTVCVSDGAADIVLGTASCAAATGVTFAWSSLPAGYLAFLSDGTSAAPSLRIPADYSGPDTIRYVLASTRTGLATTTDTVAIAVSSGVRLAGDTDRQIAFGESVVLQPGVLTGSAPLQYAWSPAAGLSDPAVAQPVASPTATTTYSLVVTDGIGCSSTNQHVVRVANPIIANPGFRDTLLCPGAVATLSVGGGSQVAWTPYPDNPTGGGELASTTGSPVDFGPTTVEGRYRFLATVTDPAFTGYSDTATITVVVLTTGACRAVCSVPVLTSEVVVNTGCGVAGGSITLGFTDGIADFTTSWRDSGGQVLADNTLGLRDLEPGTYTMTAVNTLDSTCSFSKVVFVNATDAPAALVTSVSTASCGNSDGGATVTTDGAVRWPDGLTALTRNDLSGGAYWVAVFDAATPSCARYLKVVIPEGAGLVATAAINQAPDCGVRNGVATISVLGGSGSYSYSWSSNAATATDLVAGIHRVTITDQVSGCTGQVSFVLPNAGGGADVVVTSTADQSCAGDLSGGIGYSLTLSPGVALPLDSTWTDGSGAPIANGSFGSGEYCLVLRDANRCVIGGVCRRLERAAPIAVDLTVGDACAGGAGRVDIRATEGAAPFRFRLDDGRETGDLSIEGFTPGTQGIVITDAAGCSTSGVFEIAECSPCGLFGSATQRTLQVPCGQTAELCIPNAASRRADLIVYDNGIRVTDPLTACSADNSALRLLLSQGPHRVVVYDSVNACADTLSVDVVCLPTDTQRVVVVIDSTQRFCLSTADLLGGTIVSVTNTCPDSSKASYTVVGDSCLIVRGDTLGTQTGCWVACANNGICDTTIIIVQVVPNDSVRTWRDTIDVGASGSLCLTTAELGLPGRVLTITNTCIDSSGTAVDFAIDQATGCIEYGGLSSGDEFACLILCDELGNCVRGQLFVTVVPASPPPSNKVIVYDTVFINQTSAYCPSPVLGDLDTFTGLPVHTEAGLDSAALCITYRGLTLGTDTFELRAVAAGDTTPICVIVSVVPYTGGVGAFDDATCTVRNQPKRINVLANDEVFGGIASFEIISQPSAASGSVVVNADNTVTFTPAMDICARDATFTYRVCNGNTGAVGGGCAEATVTVCIECEELTIFTALTPNGDGKNETFYVAKIEEFPNNRLQIFNRWGNLVYETTSYRNDWRGTYNGDPLPDGAYFYLLDVTNDGGTKTYNGYIEIIQ